MKVKHYNVSKIVFGEQSSYKNNILTINKDELKAYSLQGLNGYELEVHLTEPGEKTRIIHITDTVVPAWKSNGSTFPGWTEGDNNCGVGEVHHLEGVAVIQTCKYPGIQEGIVDMYGNGSSYSKFSKLKNIVVTVNLQNEEYTKLQLAKDLKLIILRAAEFLGYLTKDALADDIEKVSLCETNNDLPNVGYAYFIQAQGPLRNVHIFAEDCTKMKPRFMQAEQIIDGALVSGNYIIACQKNPTYFHQKNPVIESMLKRHGKDLNFKGVILSTESSLLEEKKENARLISEIAIEKGISGIVITQEGGGHADVDLMLTLEACENAGIKTVILTNEIAGPDGSLPPLVSISDSADAIVTNGNNDEIIIVDAMEKAIGGDEILDGKHNALDSFETSLGIMYTSTNQLGANFMTTISL